MLRLAFGGTVILVFLGKAFNTDWMFENHAYWTVQLAAIWCAMLPLFCHDPLANYFRDAGPFWIAAVATFLVTFRPAVPSWTPALVMTVMCLASLLYWVTLKFRWYVLSAAWTGALASLLWSNAALQMFDDVQLRHGLAWYAAGYAALAGGLALSLWKARSIQRGWAWLQHIADRPHDRQTRA